MSQIYGPNGQQLTAVGGEHSWRQHRKGNVVCSLQWAGNPMEPAMCLFPALNNVRAGVFVLCLSSLHKYLENTGYASKALKERGWRDIATHLGLDPLSRSVCADICGAIEDSAQDLVWMPPVPPSVERAAERPKDGGVLQIMDGGRRVLHEVEV